MQTPTGAAMIDTCHGSYTLKSCSKAGNSIKRSWCCAFEQDHRRVKQRLGPMLGLKSFTTAAVVISGIELAEKIKKGQFKIGKLCGPTATMPEIRRVALVA